ncbi:unnamed protein product [Staurois parvus]|uniref:Uncharacterized protein n=1 Tax=Staurois parvus TaxID=386267 RepID=A0ABN9FD20_9NEOB|nr:unnamed protein product [Staurois parvus]
MEPERRRMQEAGQEQLLRFWDELTAGQRESLLGELRPLEPRELREHCQRAREAYVRERSCPQRLDDRMCPVPEEFLGSVRRSDPGELRAWEEEGLHQIAENKVAVLLLAGGQGTRLGVTYPKGMYSVGLPSGKTLYQIQAERIIRLQQMAGKKYGTKCTVPWYIMTSEFTLNPTQTFFEENNYFGVEQTDVVMFEQRLCLLLTLMEKLF